MVITIHDHVYSTCSLHVCICDAYAEPLSRIDLNHISEQLLRTSRDIGGNMELPHLNLLQ
jgi:hypothetical protein